MSSLLRLTRPGFVTLARLFIIFLLLVMLIGESSTAQASPTPINPQVTFPGVIPVGKNTPVLDGVCAQGEYYSAASYTIAYVGVNGTVYLQRDDNFLYLCIASPAGSFKDRFFSVYLDSDFGQEAFAQSEDLSLILNIVSNTRATKKGTGVSNGYVDASTSPDWDGKASTNGTSDYGEYFIPLKLTGGLCGKTFGIAAYHLWFSGVGIDYGWPSKYYFDSPATWSPQTLGGTVPCGQTGSIAYVYKNDATVANAFKTLIQSYGYTVDLIPQASILTTSFTPYELIVIADDTGSLDNWGSDPAQATYILSFHKPTLGLGEGGYAYFGKHGMGIGWPHGWHGPLKRVDVIEPLLSYYHLPNDFGSPSFLDVYTSMVNEVGIYMPSAPPTVQPIGWEPAEPGLKTDHASLVSQDCNQLWGFSGEPALMSSDGQKLFQNAIVYGLRLACIPQTQKPDCLQITKSANTPDNSMVRPGDVMEYSLSYSISSSTYCKSIDTKIVDSIPEGTTFVPGSATDGISPAGGVLSWFLGDLGPSASGVKKFSVQVGERACQLQPAEIQNMAVLSSALGMVVSNQTTHPLNCAPVGLPNDQPPYAEEEISVFPYPVAANRSVDLGVKVNNLSALAQNVTVTFQVSLGGLGIGLPFTDVPSAANPQAVALPPLGTAEVHVPWLPPSAGQYSVRVKIESPGYQPIYSVRALDVAEDLRPGIESTFTFSVSNPTPLSATIDLVVDNTCPGWTAWIDPASMTGVAPGETRSATLHVTPPTGRALGTGCHIDVQAWIDGQLLGGIRKLDVPPVSLPHSSPPWEEQEISLAPTPIQAGRPTQFCVSLNKPTPGDQAVTVTFSEADFGAGIPFTQIGSPVPATIPGNGTRDVCTTWIPTISGTLHRCLLVKVSQTGYEDQFSQRNVDIVRPDGGTLSTLTIPFSIGNPFTFSRVPTLHVNLIGIQGYVPVFNPPLPASLTPGQTFQSSLSFQAQPDLRSPLSPQAGLFPFRFGSQAKVEVGLGLDGETIGGFSVKIVPKQIFMPLIGK
jgi:uncharacterized repeat protein (TIGR01451 family)